MKLKLTPQRSDSAISYAASGEILEVVVDGVSDTFDFSGIGEGEFSDFASDVLPLVPIISAARENGELYVVAISSYGPKPESLSYDSPGAFNAVVTEWDSLRFDREVEL